MFNYKQVGLAMALAFAATACSEAPTSLGPLGATNAGVEIQNAQQHEADKANQLFEDIFMANVMRSPIYQSYLGIKDDQDKWDDLSEQAAADELELQKAHLQQVLAIDSSQLDPQTQLSWLLMKQKLEQDIADYQWRHYNYPVNQMFGLHSSVASLLINQHRIRELADAEAYIARLNGLPGLFEQLVDNLKIRADKGIMAPQFVYPYVISDSRNLITGAPFDDGDASVLWTDFTGKIAALDIDDSQRQQLLTAAEAALLDAVQPAY